MQKMREKLNMSKEFKARSNQMAEEQGLSQKTGTFLDRNFPGQRPVHKDVYDWKGENVDEETYELLTKLEKPTVKKMLSEYARSELKREMATWPESVPDNAHAAATNGPPNNGDHSTAVSHAIDGIVNGLNSIRGHLNGTTNGPVTNGPLGSYPRDKLHCMFNTVLDTGKKLIECHFQDRVE